MEPSLIVTFVVTCIAFTGIWLINVLTEDAGVIDYYWGPGFSIIALIHVWFHGTVGLEQWLMLAAVIFWSGRLAVHPLSALTDQAIDVKKPGLRARLFLWPFAAGCYSAGCLCA